MSCTYFGSKLEFTVLMNQVTAVSPSLLVNEHVLVQVSLLCEALPTRSLRTYKGSFASVHPQVIEEIMPLSEEHVTTLVVAL